MDMLLDHAWPALSRILKVRIQRIAVQNVRKPLAVSLLQQVFRHIHIIIQPIKDLSFPLEKIFPSPDPLQQPLPIKVIRLVVAFMREGLDLCNHMLHRLHARTTMPRRIIQLNMRLPSA